LKERVDKSKKRREKKEAENEDYLATKKRRKVWQLPEEFHVAFRLKKEMYCLPILTPFTAPNPETPKQPTR